MNSSNSSVTPLRLRMLEDMRMRQLVPRTQEACICAAYKLTAFTKKSPAATSAQELRRFQLHMVNAGTSPITLNTTITGLNFLFIRDCPLAPRLLS
jgi:integrase/recombinase XerD